jgi:hypothetical protein
MTKKVDPAWLGYTKELRSELVAEGYIRDSGRRRNGEIVWEITDKGIAAAEAIKASGR